MTKERFAEIMQALGLKPAELAPKLCFSGSSKIYSFLNGSRQIPPHVSKMMALYLEAAELREMVAELVKLSDDDYKSSSFEDSRDAALHRAIDLMQSARALIATGGQDAEL